MRHGPALLIALFGVIAFAGAPGARASSVCPAAPTLTPAPQLPVDGTPAWPKRSAAVRAQRAWYQPRMAYGICRNKEIDAMGQRALEQARAANTIVDEWNALDRKVRAVRAARDSAVKAYAERRNRDDDGPVSLDATPPPQPPCGPAPKPEDAPSFPDPAHASAKQMRAADAALQAWLTPRAAYLGCRKIEGAALVNAAVASKKSYQDARKDFLQYRAAFNKEVSDFERALKTYTLALRAQTP